MSQSRPLAALVRSSDRVAERQRDGTYHGDEDQVAEIERYAADRGLTFELLEPELDVSGGKPITERPSLRAAIEGVEAGRYSGIVAANLKRLTRSRSGYEIWDRVEAAGGHVHTAAEAIDTSTPFGRRIRDYAIADAVAEREEHGERHAKRRAATVEAGMWRQRQVPRGYRFAGPPNIDGRFKGQARRLVPDPQAAQEVRQAARDVIDGVAIVRIAERLRMTPSGVRQLLRNRVYLGELRDGPNVNPAAHEPILDAATFAAVQHALSHNPRPARRTDGRALLQRLVYCGTCGHIMSRKRTAADVYGCQVHHSGERCPAPTAITCRLLDEHVARIFLRGVAGITAVGSALTAALETAEAQLECADRELAAYIAAVSAADVGADAFAAGARQRRQAVEESQRAVDHARDKAGVADLPLAAELEADWPTLTVAEQNALLQAGLDAVVVQRGRVPIAERTTIYWRGEAPEGVVRGRGSFMRERSNRHSG